MLLNIPKDTSNQKDARRVAMSSHLMLPLNFIAQTNARTWDGVIPILNAHIILQRRIIRKCLESKKVFVRYVVKKVSLWLSITKLN
jgi:hypothetical protein